MCIREVEVGGWGGRQLMETSCNPYPLLLFPKPHWLLTCSSALSPLLLADTIFLFLLFTPVFSIYLLFSKILLFFWPLPPLNPLFSPFNPTLSSPNPYPTTHTHSNLTYLCIIYLISQGQEILLI